MTTQAERQGKGSGQVKTTSASSERRGIGISGHYSRVKSLMKRSSSSEPGLVIGQWQSILPIGFLPVLPPANRAAPDGLHDAFAATIIWNLPSSQPFFTCFSRDKPSETALRRSKRAGKQASRQAPSSRIRPDPSFPSLCSSLCLVCGIYFAELPEATRRCCRCPPTLKRPRIQHQAQSAPRVRRIFFAVFGCLGLSDS